MDQEKTEAFADRMLNILNDGALALMTSMGHRTGLFDVMSKLPPSTTDQIAGAAGLNERYVREWLGAMVTGGFVEYDPGHATYRLPPEHAASLTRSATPDNIAAFAQYIPLMGMVEDQFVACFKNGGGVPLALHPVLHALHDGFFGRKRGRARHHVGRRIGAGHAERSGLHQNRGRETPA